MIEKLFYTPVLSKTYDNPNFLNAALLQEAQGNYGFELFDLNTDIVNIKSEKYDQTTKFTKYDQTKRLVSILYENIINYVFNKIITKMKKTKNLTFHTIKRIIQYYEKKLLEIKNEQMKIELTKQINNFVMKIENPNEDNDETDRKEIILPESTELLGLNSEPAAKVSLLLVNLASAYGSVMALLSTTGNFAKDDNTSLDKSISEFSIIRSLP